MASISAEQTSDQQLKYKTWVLKVSIYCEGCKRKVKKVLHKINGVYTISIDTQKQRVTVTGNVDVEALIKRLIKTGKHAEIWPENLAGEEKKPPGKKDPQSIIGSSRGANNNDNHNNQSSKKMEARANKVLVSTTNTTKSSETEKSKGNSEGGQPSNERENSPEKSTSYGGSGEGEKSGGGGSGSKKKKRQGQNSKKCGGGVGNCGGPAGTGSQPNHEDHHHSSSNTNNHDLSLIHSEQRYFCPHDHCNYWPSYHYHHHHLEYGNRSYTAPHRSETYPSSFFCHASSWPYTFASGHRYHQEIYDHGSFELLSDENANGCFIM